MKSPPDHFAREYLPALRKRAAALKEVVPAAEFAAAVERVAEARAVNRAAGWSPSWAEGLALRSELHRSEPILTLDQMIALYGPPAWMIEVEQEEADLSRLLCDVALFEGSWMADEAEAGRIPTEFIASAVELWEEAWADDFRVEYEYHLSNGVPHEDAARRAFVANARDRAEAAMRRRTEGAEVAK